MKKEYCKPTISFESFKMSSSIAGTCDVNLDEFQDEVGFDVFTSEASCGVPGKNGDFSLCYHGPEDNPQLFAS